MEPVYEPTSQDLPMPGIPGESGDPQPDAEQRDVRRRVGPTREESRAVTIEEPETEELSDAQQPQAPAPDPPPDTGGGVGDMDIEQETVDGPIAGEDINPPEYTSDTSYHAKIPDLFTQCIHPDDRGMILSELSWQTEALTKMLKPGRTKVNLQPRRRKRNKASS